jgi:integrase
MGEVRKRGKYYQLRYYRNGRRLEESTKYTKYDDARDLLKKREGAIADGVPVSPKIGKFKFKDAAADLETEYTVNKRKSLKHLQRRIKLHLTPFFGGRRMIDLSSADMRAFTERRLAAGAAAAEVNRELAAVKRMFTLAVQAGKLHAKPHIPMLREDNVRKGFLEPKQFADMKGHLPKPLQPLLEFAYLTGWRIASEILPLEWRQVDWEGRVVRLDPGTTKSGEGRVYPFTARLEAVLKDRLIEHERLKKEDRIIALVFHRSGKRVKNVRGAWRSACAAAGVPGRLLHDMRRSAVRNLERDGVSRSAAMAMVGHRTESIYRRYAIVDAGALRDAAAKIDRAAAG